MKLFLGNGPSAITLSYILSGHIPYWNGCPVSNDYLNVKLEQYVKDTSLLEQVSLMQRSLRNERISTIKIEGQFVRIPTLQRKEPLLIKCNYLV